MLPAGATAFLRDYPEFLKFVLAVLAVGLLYLLLVRRGWPRGGNSDEWDGGDGNGDRE